MIHGWQHLTPEDRETILRGITDGKVYGGPYHLEMDWVDKCNARCFFCNSEYIHKGESIPWEQARKHLNEAIAGGLRSVRLSGGGEPTLHANFPDLLRMLGQHGVVLDNLTTNGTQLTDRVLDALMGVRITEIRVSLNFPTADTYAEGMGLPAKFFDRVVEMTRKLSLARRAHPDFGRLMLQVFIYKPTMHLIRQSYELARELGADLITFRELWNIDPALCFTAEDVPSIIDQMRDIIREDWRKGIVESHLDSHGANAAIAQVYDELRAELGGAPPMAPHPVNEQIRYCYIGWYSMTVIGNQAVYPCCYLLPNNVIPPVDSLKTKSLAEAWRGDRFNLFRKEMRDFFILQRPVPLFDKRVKTIGPSCATHNGCPLGRSLCDEAFFEEADRRLEAVRHQPTQQLWRLANRAGRFMERHLRKP